MRNSLLFFLLLVIRTAGAQNVYEQSIVMIAHDHRFRAENFDGKNDFTEMVEAGITVKTVCLTTDIQDWSLGKVVRLETDSAIQTNFGYTSWTAFFEGRLNTLTGEAAKPNSTILIIKRKNDVYRAKKKRKAGLLLGTEGVRFLNGSLEKLSIYHRKGLRHLQLYREPIAQGAAITEEGITEFGKNLIRNCNSLGIALDVTHIQNLKNGNAILREVIQASEKPVMFSHQHGKEFGGALTDEQIIAVAKSGSGHGVIAFHLIENFVKPADIQTLLAIIRHIKSLVGIDHIAIGADYSPTSAYRWVLRDYREFPRLAKAMEDDGFTPTEIEKVLGLNLLEFYNYSWK